METNSVESFIINEKRDEINDEIDFIIGSRSVDKDQVEFLLKLIGKSYRDSIWVHENVLKKHHDGRRLIGMYRKQMPPQFDAKNIYDPSYNEIDRIVYRENQKYLVKWKNLPFTQLTWEENIDFYSLQLFESRIQAKHPKINRLAPKNHKKLNYIVNDSTMDCKLDNNQTITTNVFIDHYNQQSNVNIDSMHGIFSPISFLALCEKLYRECDEYGPFLILSPLDNILKIYQLVSTHPFLTTLCYYGHLENLEIINKHAFSSGNEFMFQIMITTPEIFSQPDHKLHLLDWTSALVFKTSSMSIPEGYLKSSNIICVHSEPLQNFAKTTNHLLGVLQKVDGCISSQDILRIRSSIKDYSKEEDDSNEIQVSYQLSYIECDLSEKQKKMIKLMITSNYPYPHNIKECLCRMCTHPYLIPNIEYQSNMNLIDVSTKMSVLMKLCKKGYDNNEHIVVVSQYEKMLDMIEDLFYSMRISFSRQNDGSRIILINSNYEDSFHQIGNPSKILVLDGNENLFTKYGDVYRLICSSCAEHQWKELDNDTILNLITFRAFERTVHLECDGIYLRSKPRPLQKFIIDHVSKTNVFMSKLYSNLSDSYHSQQYLENTQLSIRLRNQVFRLLRNFGWGCWQLFEPYLPLRLNSNIIRRISVSLLSYSLNFIENPEDFKIIQDILVDEVDYNSYIIFDDDFSNMVKNQATSFLSMVQNLYIVHIYTKSSSFKIPTIAIPRAAAQQTPWWNDESDMALILGIKEFGYGYIDMFPFSRDDRVVKIINTQSYLSIYNRAKILFDEIRKNTSLNDSMMELFLSPQHRGLISEGDLYKLYNRLMNYGHALNENGERDYSKTCDSIGIIGLNDQILTEIMDGLIVRCSSINFDHTLLKAGQKFLRKLRTIESIHILFSNRSRDSAINLINRAPKWKKVPTSLNANLEYELYMNIIEFGFSNLGQILEYDMFKSLNGDKFAKLISKLSTMSARVNIILEISKHSVEESQKEEVKSPKTKSRKQKQIDSPKQKKPIIENKIVEPIEQPRIVDIPQAPPSHHKELEGLSFPITITATSKIISLGDVVSDRPGFHSERYIYPAGFKTSRIHKSTVHPDQTTTWYSEIVDTGLETPIFRVQSEDGSSVYEGTTPTAPWSQILKDSAKLNGITGRALAVSGPEMYLLSNNLVSSYIEMLPGIEKCKKYVPKEIKQANKKEIIIESLPIERPASQKAKIRLLATPS